MTMSLFHNLKLKRRKVDSRSSSDGSEVATADMISPPSLASSSSTEDQQRPNSQHSGFEVEVKPNKFEIGAPRYTSWASPAKLKQEPYYGDETPTITATVVPKLFSNGSSSPPPTSTLPTSSTASVEMHRLSPGGHRLAEALRPPPAAVTTIPMHLPLAAAAAAAKLQAMHPNMVTSSHHHHHHHHHPASSLLHNQQSHNLRMTGPPPLPSSPAHHLHPSRAIVKSEPAKTSLIGKSANGSSSPVFSTASSAPPSSPNSNAATRKQGPSVILGEHGGVKTMIWTDSATHWQAAKYRQQVASQSQVPLPPLSMAGGVPHLPISTASISSSSVAVTASSMDRSSPSVSLKLERPEVEQLKMSNAVDGLLSLSAVASGSRPSPQQMMQIMSSAAASPSPIPQSVMSHVSASDLKVNFTVQAPSLHQQAPPPRRRSPMNMERLWAGDLSQLPSHVIESQNGHHLNAAGMRPTQDPEDEEPLLCNICEDRATGLHYGIITCEGCKGFFKRTVQNKRVYSCVADGNCEINKAQRNRCQFCRFKKCLQQGMVLAAVREDRMPGGRNSGAVYNMYKVKYKKHKRTNSTNSASGKSSSTPSTPGPPQTIPSSTSAMDLDPFRRPRSESSGGGGMEKFMMGPDPVTTCSLAPITTLPIVSSPAPLEMYPNPNKGLLGGVNILRAALTGSNDIPQQYKNLGRQAKDKYEEHHSKLINELIECDEFNDIATLKNIGELLSQNSSDLEDKLCKIGDSIVHKLVEWVTRLPFYHQLPKEVHTKLLTHKWHELLVLTTSAYQAIHGFRRMGTTRTDGEKVELHQEVATNLVTLQTCLTSMMGRPITMDQLRQDVGNMVEKITKVIAIFRQFQLKMEEYVCLKVIAMVSQEGLNNPTLDVIHDKYLACLRSFAKKHFPNQPNRVEELLVRLPEVQVAASLLLESKMFYVPFLLNSTID